MRVNARFYNGSASHEFDDVMLRSREECIRRVYKLGDTNDKDIFRHIVGLMACLYGEGKLQTVMDMQGSGIAKADELWKMLTPYCDYEAEIEKTVSELLSSGLLPADFEEQYDEWHRGHAKTYDGAVSSNMIWDVDPSLYSAMYLRVMDLKDRVNILVKSAFELNCKGLRGKYETWTKFVERMFGATERIPPFTFLPDNKGTMYYLKNILPINYWRTARPSPDDREWQATRFHFSERYKDYFRRHARPIDGQLYKQENLSSIFAELDEEHFGWVQQRRTIINTEGEEASSVKLQELDARHCAERDAILARIQSLEPACDDSWRYARVKLDGEAWDGYIEYCVERRLAYREYHKGVKRRYAEAEKARREAPVPIYTAMKNVVSPSLSSSLGEDIANLLILCKDSGKLDEALAKETSEERMKAAWELLTPYTECDKFVEKAINLYMENDILPKTFRDRIPQVIIDGKVDAMKKLARDRITNYTLRMNSDLFSPIIDIYDSLYFRAKMIGYKVWAIFDFIIPPLVKGMPDGIRYVDSYLWHFASGDDPCAPFDLAPLDMFEPLTFEKRYSKYRPTEFKEP